MRTIFILLFIFSTGLASAQINAVNLQASGLTCSMCSNAINKALKSIDYVDKVTADIKNSSFEITFRPGAKVNFDQLKKKVEAAGFSVAKLSANIHFDNLLIENENHVTVAGMAFHFLNMAGQQLDGDKVIRVLDKGYVSPKEYKKNQAYTKMDCYRTGMAAGCCSKAGITTGTRIFHVTI